MNDLQRQIQFEGTKGIRRSEGEGACHSGKNDRYFRD
jgi:hypothetical protein